jgi:hypothetical protein
MTMTKHTVAEKLMAYLQHRLTLAGLVEWAETSLMDGDFSEEDADVLRAVIPRIGSADVRGFGLTWEDCEDILASLGYGAKIELLPA